MLPGMSSRLKQSVTRHFPHAPDASGKCLVCEWDTGACEACPFDAEPPTPSGVKLGEQLRACLD